MIDLADHFSRGKNAVNEFIKAILNEYEYCRLVIKRHFNKNLVMTVKDEKVLSINN